MNFRDRNGILIPADKQIPDQIGFGCPKCDASVVVPYVPGRTEKEIGAVCSAFLALHLHAETIHCIEMRDKTCYVTGELTRAPSKPEEPPS